MVAEIKGLAGGAHFDLPLHKGNITMKGWFSDDVDRAKNDLPAFFAYVEHTL